jgi:hypothetical protein
LFEIISILRLFIAQFQKIGKWINILKFGKYKLLTLNWTV